MHLTNNPGVIPPPPRAYHMQLLPCPPGFTRDYVGPRQHAVVVAFDHDRADYAGGAPFYLSYLELSPLDLSYSYLATKECHPAQPKHKKTNIMQKQRCFLHPPLHKNFWDASCLFSAVPSREVCRRKGSHIHDWRSARQPISPSIGDWKLTCV